jgi:signal transduction histidine kinase
MAGDLTTTLRVLTHEMRTPVGVIQGYVRMLSDGRVNSADQAKVFKQIRDATTRVADLGDQIDELLRWLPSDTGHPEGTVALPALLADASALARFGTRVQIEHLHEAAVRTSDERALVRTCATLMDTVARESLDVVRLWTRPGADHTQDLIFSADATVDDLASLAGPSDAGTTPLALDRGGLGMSLVCAAAVVDAHQGTLWQLAGRRAVAALRLPGA